MPRSKGLRQNLWVAQARAHDRPEEIGVYAYEYGKTVRTGDADPRPDPRPDRCLDPCLDRTRTLGSPLKCAPKFGPVPKGSEGIVSTKMPPRPVMLRSALCRKRARSCACRGSVCGRPGLGFHSRGFARFAVDVLVKSFLRLLRVSDLCEQVFEDAVAIAVLQFPDGVPEWVVGPCQLICQDGGRGNVSGQPGGVHQPSGGCHVPQFLRPREMVGADRKSVV